ncbi:MAG: PIN domain-containing protein [Deltaproteobacteria bacterium]|nr:PIN domain-containing protein [Deltaproteobacteria bacterium]
MSGKVRFILDTNAVVSLLNGNLGLALQLEAAEYVGISVITYLEFLAFEGLSALDRKSFERFTARVEVVPLDHSDDQLTALTLDLRCNTRLKLPDAIIGATAISRKAILITNDSHFSNVPSLIVREC